MGARLVVVACLLAGCGSAPDATPTPAAAPPPAAPAPSAPVLATDAGDAEDAAIVVARDAFLGDDDGPHLDVLSHGEITLIERGSGGRSLAFRLTFTDGSQGYFKPAQTFSGSHFYAEIASYHLDRLLGLGRVPPTVGRRLPWAPLRAAGAGDGRLDEALVDGESVCGSLSYWIPTPLVRLRAGLGWEAWVRFGGGLAISPFQRARLYAAQATGALELPEPVETTRAAERPDTDDRAAELSDLVLFDYLTENIDRWGGDYTNVRTLGAGGPLVYLDNAAGFMDARLHAVQRFRRSTVEAIRGLSIDALRVRVEADACAPILDERLYAQLEERRTALLAHVDRMVAEHGERALAW